MLTSINKPAAIASILDAPFKVKPRIVPASAIRANNSTQPSEPIPTKSKIVALYQLRKVRTMEVRPSALRHLGSSRRNVFPEPSNDKMSSEGIARIMTIARILFTGSSGTP
jgi:hypothetical protein